MSSALVNEAVRRDFFTCLGIWLSLETLVFGVLPLVGLAPLGEDLRLWLTASFALGIVGACLLSFGVWMGRKSRAAGDRLRRFFVRLLGQMTSWLGLLGIAFPLLVMSISTVTNVFSVLIR